MDKMASVPAPIMVSTLKLTTMEASKCSYYGVDLDPIVTMEQTHLAHVQFMT